MFSHTAKKYLRTQGLRIQQYPNGEHLKIASLLQRNKIDLVLDVGANEGQYAGYLRSIGYAGKIVSFEPLQDAFTILQQKANNVPGWTCYQLALGNTPGESLINVSANSQSSSILNMNAAHLDAAPDAGYSHQQAIKIETLDIIFQTIVGESKNILLKLDVQGYEKFVLAGAVESLKKIKGIQLEMSFHQLYDGEMLYQEMMELMEKNDFTLCALKNGFHDVASGRLLQADGFFFKL